jgi:hypothetical protein
MYIQANMNQTSTYLGKYACVQYRYIGESACMFQYTGEYACIGLFTGWYTSNMHIYRQKSRKWSRQESGKWSQQKLRQWSQRNFAVNQTVGSHEFCYDVFWTTLDQTSRQNLRQLAQYLVVPYIDQYTCIHLIIHINVHEYIKIYT